MAAAAPRGRWPRRCSPAEVPACRSPSAARWSSAAASRTGVWSRPPPWPPCCSAETTSAGAPALQRLDQLLLAHLRAAADAGARGTVVQLLLGELGEGGGVVGCRTRAVAGVWLRRILAAAAPLLRRLDARAQRLHEIGDLRRRLLGLDHDLLAGALLLDQLRDALTADWDHAAYSDTYRDRVAELI